MKHRRIQNRKRYVKGSRGFALPLAMMLGVVILTIAFASIMASQNGRDFAKSRIDSNANFLVAEGAVARTLDQFSSSNNSPLLTLNYDPINPATGKTFLGPDGIINSGDEESVAVNQWAAGTPSNCPSGTASPSISYSGTIGTNPYTFQAYRYDPVKQQGHLLVKGGQVNQTSAIQVTVSIAPSQSTALPGLWIQDNSKSKISGGQLQTDIWDSTCPSNSNSANATSLQSAQAPIPPGNTPVVYKARPGIAFPALPTAGTTPPPASRPGTYALAQITNSTGSLPRSSDTPNNGVLTYHVGNQNSINLSGGSILRLGTGNGTIVLYLDGGINLSGGSSIQLTSGTKLIIYANGDLTLSGGSTTAAIANNSSSANVQIYEYTPSHVDLSGGSVMKMFLFAPQSTVTFSGSSNVAGTIWANSWVGSGSSVITENPLNLSQTEVTGFPGKMQITGVTGWSKVGL